jgi:hypothetical protein
MKIPAGANRDIIMSAMDILMIDPNFSLLCQIVRENDIELLKSSLISGRDINTKEKLTTEETEEMRYKLGVFEEFIAMPKTILDSVKSVTAHVEERESLDPYHTEESLRA